MNLLAVLSCEKCGGALRSVTVGRIIAGREGNTMWECTQCLSPYLVSVSMIPAFANLDTDQTTHRSVAACGTEGGYSRHRREGTHICEHCAAAHREANARRAKRRPSTVGAL